MASGVSNLFALFLVDGKRYAIPLAAFVRSERAVGLTALRCAPKCVLGVIMAGGQIVPVYDMRRCLALSEREIHPDDQLIIATAGTRMVALFVDTLCGVVERDVAAMNGIDADATLIMLEGDLTLIPDLAPFIAAAEGVRAAGVGGV